MGVYEDEQAAKVAMAILAVVDAFRRDDLLPRIVEVLSHPEPSKGPAAWLELDSHGEPCDLLFHYHPQAHNPHRHTFEPLYLHPPRQEASRGGESELRRAADAADKEMVAWLAEGCECPPEGHHCGRRRVAAVRDRLRAALDAAPPGEGVEAPEEGSPPFRLEPGAADHIVKVVAWDGTPLAVRLRMNAEIEVANLNRLFAIRSSAAPPPAVSEGVREAARPLTEAVERCADYGDGALVLVSLGELRRLHAALGAR